MQEITRPPIRPNQRNATSARPDCSRVVLLSACCLLGSVLEAARAEDDPGAPLAKVTEAKSAAAPSGSEKQKPSANTLGTIQVTATLRPEDSARISAPVTVVDSELLHGQTATPIEALRGQAGAFVQQTTPGQSAVFVRGAKGSEVLHLVDGFRLNSTIFRNAPNQFFALVDGQALDRIELLRGPSGSFYGSDAMGGVVQMLSVDPLDQETHSQQQTLRLRADSGQNLALGHFAAAARGERLAARVALSSVDTDARRIGSGTHLPFSNFSSQAISARLGFDAGEAGRFGVNLQYLRQPRTPRHDELVPGFGQTQPNAVVASFEPQARGFVQLTHAIDVDWLGFDQLHWQVGRQRIIDDRRTQNRGSSTEATEFNSDRLTGASIQLTSSKGQAHAFSVGAEFYHDRVRSSRTNTNVNTGIASVGAARFPDRARQQSLAVFALDNWQIDTRWNATLSARYSRFDLDLPPANGIPAVEISPDAGSGHAGLSYALNESTHLVANVGRGFRAPNVFDVGQFGERSGNRFAAPNPDLGAEKVTSYDLGLKHSDGRLEGELFGFYSRFTDKIVSALTGETTADGRLVVQNRNAARARSIGFEAAARYRFSDDWAARLGLNYTRGTETLDGVKSAGDRIPPLNAELSLEWSPLTRLLISAEVISAARQDRLSDRDLSDIRINPEGTGGYTQYNLSARYALGPRVDLLARLDNIADHNFREHGSGINAIGRNLLVGADLRF